ncbi:MAG: hypothetical protein AB7O97_04645 [Planctomycetota bacterium]
MTNRTRSSVAVAVGAWILSACSTPWPRRDPTGERFPSVTATALDGTLVRVPEDFAGAPLVLLVGYEQDAQFDADRWLLGLLQAEVPVAIRELPTIPGFVPRLLAGTIDSGMRSGIPDEDWGAVITVYDDAAAVAAFTGNEAGRTMRVLLLDERGTVAWFHDRGYSAGTLLRLLEALGLRASGGAR